MKDLFDQYPEWVGMPEFVQEKKQAFKEVIVRFVSDIVSNDTFYTDSNGREMITRVVNFRPTYNLTVTQPVAGNYYPVDAAIAIVTTHMAKVGGRVRALLQSRETGKATHPTDKLEFNH